MRSEFASFLIAVERNESIYGGVRLAFSRCSCAPPLGGCPGTARTPFAIAPPRLYLPKEGGDGAYRVFDGDRGIGAELIGPGSDCGLEVSLGDRSSAELQGGAGHRRFRIDGRQQGRDQ